MANAGCRCRGGQRGKNSDRPARLKVRLELVRLYSAHDCIPAKSSCCGLSSQCHGFNETVILAVANAVASSPLKAAGYEYINLDCGYSTGFRGPNGTLTVNTNRYPHGMVWLGERIHELGLKFGMYSDAGERVSTCHHGMPTCPCPIMI